MLDVEPIVLDELGELSPFEPELRGDWAAVLAASGPPLRSLSRKRRAAFTLAAIVAGLVLIGSALGAAGIGPLSPIGAWLRGTPGSPAPRSAVRSFRAENGHSWASFPRTAKLRMLIARSFGGQRYVLYGFRSGNSVCLTLAAKTLRTSLGPACAPVSAVEHLSAPVLAVAADRTVAAFPDRRSAQVSFGISADQVRRVVVETVDGNHTAAVGGNAYLWVDTSPASFDRVTALDVTTANGASTRVPVEISDLLVGPVAPPTPTGPTRVQKTIRDPHVGWVRRGETRGLSQQQAHLTPTQSRLVPGSGVRFFKPDPTSNIVVGFDGGCLYLDGGSACIGPTDMFKRGPLWYMVSVGGGVNRSDVFSTVAGVAADGVAYVRAFLSDGTSVRLPLEDNVFAGVIPNHPPFKLVAYAADGEVVGLVTLADRPPAPRAARRLHPVLHVTGAGAATATLSVGLPVHGTQCWRLVTSANRGQHECTAAVTGPSVTLQGVQSAGGAVFVFGTTRSPVARVYLLFDDGTRTAVERAGTWFLGTVPARELAHTRRRARVVGVTRSGDVVQRPAFFYKEG
jgi:hypothetical protein